MTRERLILWLGEPSPHQSGWLNALPDLLPRRTVITVFQRELPAERLALGWRVPKHARMQAIMTPDRRTIDELAAHDPANTVHVFGGMRLPMIRRALGICARNRALMGVVSEARDADGTLGTLRLLHSHFVERPYRKRMDFVLAIGQASAQWYERCGYRNDRIFPWSYVVQPPPQMPLHHERDSSAQIVVSYVGRFIASKAVDTLLRALARLRTQNWSLQLIGHGPERPRLEALADALLLAHRVRFLGAQDNVEIWRLLGGTDLLVLPSRFEGWGAVVNEALMSGTPVVCSDRCGAAELLRANDLGETFRAGSSDALASVLRRWIASGPLPDERRQAIRRWSSCIAGDALARYLVGLIAHVDEGKDLPPPPWLAARMPAARTPGEPATEESHAQFG